MRSYRVSQGFPARFLSQLGLVAFTSFLFCLMQVRFGDLWTSIELMLKGQFSGFSDVLRFGVGYCIFALCFALFLEAIEWVIRRTKFSAFWRNGVSEGTDSLPSRFVTVARWSVCILGHIALFLMNPASVIDSFGANSSISRFSLSLNSEWYRLRRDGREWWRPSATPSLRESQLIVFVNWNWSSQVKQDFPFGRKMLSIESLNNLSTEPILENYIRGSWTISSRSIVQFEKKVLFGGALREIDSIDSVKFSLSEDKSGYSTGSRLLLSAPFVVGFFRLLEVLPLSSKIVPSLPRFSGDEIYSLDRLESYLREASSDENPIEIALTLRSISSPYESETTPRSTGLIPAGLGNEDALNRFVENRVIDIINDFDQLEATVLPIAAEDSEISPFGWTYFWAANLPKATPPSKSIFIFSKGEQVSFDSSRPCHFLKADFFPDSKESSMSLWCLRGRASEAWGVVLVLPKRMPNQKWLLRNAPELSGLESLSESRVLTDSKSAQEDLRTLLENLDLKTFWIKSSASRDFHALEPTEMSVAVAEVVAILESLNSQALKDLRSEARDVLLEERF